MTAFEPRLLQPRSSATPKHIIVDDHPAVLDEMQNPRVTAVVYIPKWSEPVRAAFARIAAHATAGISDYEDRISIAPHMIKQLGDVEDFAFESTANWLQPVYQRNAFEESISITREIAQAKAQFAAAAARNLPGNPERKPYMHTLLRVLDVNDEADTRLQPHSPQLSQAHTDPGDAGLFSHPLGTVLVDQTGLDIKSLSTIDTHTVRKGRPIRRIALSHLANRLWQIPDASFALWRGEPNENAQFHFFPQISHNMLRYRAFAHP